MLMIYLSWEAKGRSIAASSVASIRSMVSGKLSRGKKYYFEPGFEKILCQHYICPRGNLIVVRALGKFFALRTYEYITSEIRPES